MPRGEAYYYIVDSYRLRVDDEYNWTGDAGGLYGGETDDAFSEFAQYVELAREKNLLPRDWNERSDRDLNKVAAKLLPYALEKSDLKDLDRYKSSPFISIELRGLAEAIYGHSIGSF